MGLMLIVFPEPPRCCCCFFHLLDCLDRVDVGANDVQHDLPSGFASTVLFWTMNEQHDNHFEGTYCRSKECFFEPCMIYKLHENCILLTKTFDEILVRCVRCSTFLLEVTLINQHQHGNTILFGSTVVKGVNCGRCCCCCCCCCYWTWYWTW